MTSLGEWDTHNEPVEHVSLPVDPPYYPTLPAFVHDFLARTYVRAVDGRSTTWCPKWWHHAEAVYRLEALWRSWELLRLEPATGISDWLRDHADHHMTILLSPDGPFRGCSPTKGHQSREPLRLPVEDPPPGWYRPPTLKPST